MVASGRREHRPLPIRSCGTNVRTRTAVRGVGAPGQPRAVRSVLNDFAVSRRPPGFRWQERRPPSRICAAAQRPLAPRPSGVHFRFVQLVAELESLRQTAAGKAAAARWWARDELPPRVRAPGCPGFACGAAPRMGASLPAPSARAALGHLSVAVPRARAQTPRSLFSGFPQLRVRPGQARAPLSWRKLQPVCAPRAGTGKPPRPPRRVWAALGSLEAAASSEAPVSSGAAGSEAGPEEAGRGGQRTPLLRFGAHPGPQRPPGASGQDGRGAGAGDGGCYPRKGPRNPGSRQEGRPTLRAALWLLEHRAGGSQPCFR